MEIKNIISGIGFIIIGVLIIILCGYVLALDINFVHNSWIWNDIWQNTVCLFSIFGTICLLVFGSGLATYLFGLGVADLIV